MKKPNKKGFTLLEVVIATAITAIVFGMVMFLFTAVRDMVNSTIEDATADSVCDSINVYVRSNLQNAVKISVVKYDSATAQTTLDGFKEADRLTKALVVTENSNGLKRLYDLGDVTAATDSISVFNSNKEDFRVFNEDFYYGRNFKFEFMRSAGTTNWLSVQTQGFDDENQQVNMAHKLAFKLLAIAINNYSIESGLTADDDYLVLYNIIVPTI